MSKLFSKINLSYSIDYKTENNTYIFCGVESNKTNKILESEFIMLKKISWKFLFSLMTKIKYLWRIKHFNNELTLEFQSFSKELFSKLKSCPESFNLREKNKILENDINTEFQTILFDFLYNEQELYVYYDELFEKKKYIPKNKNIPFGSFITNYKSLFLNIYNDKKKIKRLKKLRWYLTFDEENFLTVSPSTLFSFLDNEEIYNKNNMKNELNMLNNSNFCFGGNNLSLYGTDSYNDKEKDCLYKKFINDDKSLDIKNELKEYKPITISDDIINNLLEKEENPLLYTVKLISITITVFCRENMCYLNSTFKENKNVELIKEYIKRFNNFVQVAKYINSQCENINIVMNYLDKDILKNYPHFPKFSIFRLCLKIWYTEMCSVLTEDNSSLLTKIRNSTLQLFSKYIYDDLTNIKINSFQSFLFNSGEGSSLFFKSKGEFNLSTSISLFNSNSNNQTLSSTICPFGSYYEDSNIKYTILEKSLSIIYETFSDEYSVYLFNLSNIDANNYYDDIENNIIDLIESSIQKMFNYNININSNDSKNIIKIIVEKILNYFNGYFYSHKIIKKLKKRINTTINIVLKNLIFEQFGIKIEENLKNQKYKNAEYNIIEINLNEKYLNELHRYLIEKKNINIEKSELKKILSKINDVENVFDVLIDIDNWLEKEIQIIETTDKRVLKELDKKNISSSYNNLQKYLLSFSVRNNWETIRKIRTIENYHQKLNNKKEENNNFKLNSLKHSINMFSINEDLNNLNQFYSEDFDNFGNIDYFSEQNNDLNNQNNFMNINNNNCNLSSGLNNLNRSSIFFG